MGSYLISGLPGSGKSTIIGELARRGYAAFNTDDMPEVTRLEDSQTGESVDWPDGAIDFTKFAWNWQENGLLHLLDTDKDIFVGASVSNQDEYQHLFTKIFVLMLSPTELSERLLSRSSNTYGKHPEELARILHIQPTVERGLLDTGAVAIDASKPIDTIITEILNHVERPNVA